MTMNKGAARAQLMTQYGVAQNQLAAIEVALNLFNEGYESDQNAITEGIQAGIAQAVSEATAPLQARIEELEAQLASYQTPAPTEEAAAVEPDAE